MNYHFWALSWTEVVAIYWVLLLIWNLNTGGSFLLQNNCFGAEYQVAVLYKMSESACQSPTWLSVEGTDFYQCALQWDPLHRGLPFFWPLAESLYCSHSQCTQCIFPQLKSHYIPSPHKADTHPTLKETKTSAIETSDPGSCTAAFSMWDSWYFQISAAELCVIC